MSVSGRTVVTSLNLPGPNQKGSTVKRTAPIASSRVPARRGFTLVEVLTVVVILGIVAAITVPQFTSAASQSRENSSKMNLHRIRTQLEIYKQQHNGNWPTFADIEDQLTLASDVNGATAAVGTSGFNFGPYLRNIPPNPDTGGSTIGTGAVGSSDWYYDENTGQFLANDSALSRTY